MSASSKPDDQASSPDAAAETVSVETVTTASPSTTTIVIQQPKPGRGRVWFVRFLVIGLLASLAVNAGMYQSYRDYFSESSPPAEKFHSGDADSPNKIAILRMSATIMPPFTERMLQSIERAKDDESVKGVVLVIDSPGGLVADSHQIYHRLLELSEKKPVVVAMQRIAASGGYYIAMGAGPNATIYAEPTTWTGSIGVIIPRYNATELAGKIGVSSQPLKTGRFKDSLSPFRPLQSDETELWREILNDSFESFLDVIATNRKGLYRKDQRLFGIGASAHAALSTALDEKPGVAVEDVATGQIFTAKQALKLGLVDKIGFIDDAIDDLKAQLDLKSARIVSYQHPITLMSLLASSVKAQQPEHQWQMMMDAAVPRAMYYCSGIPIITVHKAEAN